MAQLLAPYNNSMRLGQGFNSYTQQICLDRAVLPDTTDNRVQLRKAIVLSKKNKAATPKTLVAGAENTITDNSPKQIENGGAETNGQKLDNVLDGDDGSEVESPSQGSQKTLSKPNEAGQPNQQNPPPADEKEETLQVYPWVKPQIVTYSSRFVDKLSDVTGEKFMDVYSMFHRLKVSRCDECVRFIIY